MKTKLTGMVILVLALTACSDTGYKKMKSGLVYKLIAGDSKDSAINNGNVVKLHFIRKINDSLIYSSYGKMASFIPMNPDPGMAYSPLEVLYLMRKGDSAVIVEAFDTLIKRGMTQQMPFGKKGDRIVTNIKILEVYRTDSLARIDYEAEMARDKPRQEQEMKEFQEKQVKAIEEQFKKDVEEWKKSGEIDRENKEVEAFLAAKNIKAQKTETGTYVQVKQKGTGEPVVDGKYLTVKYTGKLLPQDTVFESSVYIFQIGYKKVIAGWDDGLKLFNEGGVGQLFVPGYLAYGKGQGPGGKPFQSLLFDVEVLNVSDTEQQAQTEKQKADSIAAAKKPVK
jgi:FKBP-type peptidyl-prolyl cis-trans isomerase